MRLKPRATTLKLGPIALAMALAVNGTFSASPPRAKVEISKMRLLADGSRSLELPAGTTLAGVEVPSSTTDVELRIKRGKGWGPWIEMHVNPDEGPDAGTETTRSFAGPIWLGEGADRVQVRSEGRRNITLHAIASPEVRTTGSAQASPGQPYIASRSEWGADESIKTCSPSYASNVRNAFVHHTDTGNDYSADQVAQIIRGIYAFHVYSRGWCDIGYNFLVDKWGRVFEGRYGGITKAVIGAHAGGFNTGSTGVSVLGNFTATNVPDSALRGIAELLAWKFSYHGVDAGSQVSATSGGSTRYPEGQVVRLWNISGHRDVSLTACPGDGLYPSVPWLRTEVQRRVLSSPPNPLPGWTPSTAGPKVLGLDSFGGLHPAGAQASVTHTAHWNGFPIARGGFFSSPGKGFVMDGYGGIHGFGGNLKPAIPGAYWPGWDIARGAARGPIEGSGYKLDGWGGVHPFGGAPPMQTTGYWSGWDIARAIATDTSGLKGYVLDGWGGLHPLGGAPSVTTTAYWSGWDIARGIALRPNGRSGYILDGWGGVHAFGGAPRITSTHYTPGQDMHRGIALNQAGDGGWVIDTNGEIWPFGNASGLKMSMTYTGTGLGEALLMSPPTSTAT